MTKNLRFVSSMFFAFLLGCSVVNVGGNAEDYFPMEEGNTWVYEVRTASEIDTLSYTMRESNPGLFTWSGSGSNGSIFSADISDGSDPFNDSVVVVVDSALLLWAGANLSIPFGPERLKQISVGFLETEYGKFENCIYVSGPPDTEGKSYSAWLAKGIGPVRIERLEKKTLIKEFLLLDFYSVK